MSLWSGKSLRVVILLVVAALVFIGGRLSHRFDRYLPPYNFIQGDRSPFHRQFEPLAKLFFDYLSEHDGFIPADPYRALIESGKVASFSDFLFDGNHHADMNGLMPVRVNPRLEENAKIPLLRCFCYSGWSGDEDHVWVAWADGTITYELVARHSAYIQAWNWWAGLYKEVGYPNLFAMPFAERAKWIADHRDQFVWDASRRIYVLPHAATATAP